MMAFMFNFLFNNRITWFHVIVGTSLYLYVCTISCNHLTPKNHFGFEAAAWYWHFVDVVWLLVLFVFIGGEIFGMMRLSLKKKKKS